MQLNKMVKGLAMAIPFMMLAACTNTSTGEDVDPNSFPNQNQNQNANGSIQAQLEELQRVNIVYFAFNKYDITTEFATLLDAHAEFLRTNTAYRITIEGHADERGTPEYNIALGERRANAVFMYLQGKGVSANQLTVVSYGKEKLAALGHDEATHAQNRRAVLAY